MGNFMLQELIDNGPVMRTVSLPRGRQSLHAMPTSTGYEIRNNATYDWDGRKRGNTPFTVLQHTIAGAGNLRYENRSYRVREGETLLLLVPHNHRYWLEDGGRWEFFWISMNGDEALRIHRALLAVTGPVLKLQPETIEHLADCSLRLIRGGETPGRASAIAYEAAMAVSYGLPPEEGLKAVTLNAARVLGVEKELGSIEPGKRANLILTTGDPLQVATQTVLLFIDGKPIAPVSKHTKLYERYQQRLREVEAALARMDDGTYGICEETGDPIPYGRLLAEPTARYTIEAQELLEREDQRDRTRERDEPPDAY